MGSSWPRSRHSGPRGLGTRRGAQRHDPWRSPRLCLHRRCPPHHGPVARWRGCRHVHAVGHGRLWHRADQFKHINAHGTSTDKNDAAEAEAVAKVFSTDDSARWSPRPRASPAMRSAPPVREAVAVLLAMQHGKVPPTAGLIERTPNFRRSTSSRRPANWEPGPSLSNSSAGGHNGTLVLGPA